MRIALVYDCLYPHTVGGAERWLRALAEELAHEHRVVYLTRRQWPRGEEPRIPGVECVAVAPGGRLYTAAGRRRLLPPLLFGAGVLLHLLRHRRDYDVVHCLSYPYTGLLAIRLALMGQRGTRVFCEWLECPTAEYWRSYAGPLGGRLGQFLQRVCVRLTGEAFAFSELVAARLRQEGFSGQLHRLPGLWAGERVAPRPRVDSTGRDGEPLVLFAGRHVPDKRVTVLAEALARARGRRPLRALIVGDGPERPRLLRRIRELDLEGAVEAPGFVERAELQRLLGAASCAVSPSVRDGHGMAVVEAIAAGTPAVVCRHPDNAAVEVVEDGVNGAVARSPAAEDIADAILRVLDAGGALAESTARWAEANCERMSMKRSIERVQEIYQAAPPPAPTAAAWPPA